MNPKAKILVIDDEDIVLRSCSRVLSKDGYEIVTARNGYDGLAKAAGEKPDLALVDLKMPGMSGLEVLSKLKEIDEHIVTVMITGHGTIDRAVEAMKRHAFDFITKPFEAEKLRFVVKRGLKLRHYALEAQRLTREKEKMKNSFITMVTHQLKSPLSTVEQYIQVLLDGMQDDADPESKEIILRIQDRIKQLMQLIADWLGKEKIDAENLKKYFTSLNIGPLLKEAIDLNKPIAEQKNVEIKSDIPPLPPLNGDRDALREAFSNLIGNAVKYNREGGSAFIRGAEKEGELIVSITDTGIGISEEHIPRIFDDFYRIKNDQTRNTGGTGLGLSIVKKIIDVHKGRIEVQSKPGEGTTFKVFLSVV